MLKPKLPKFFCLADDFCKVFNQKLRTHQLFSGAYYRFILKEGQHRLARFAKVVWEIPSEGKNEKDLAKAGIDAREDWIKEIRAASNVSGLGVTDAMLEGIADATILGGGYKKLTRDDVIQILKNSK